MKIIYQVIEELEDPSTRLTEVFKKAKVLAYKLKSQELINWVQSELIGYALQELPEYRKPPSQLLGDLRNGKHIRKNFPIPLNGLSDSTKEKLEAAEMIHSLPKFEKFLKQKNENPFIIGLPPEINSILTQILDNGFEVENVRWELDKAAVRESLVTLRQILLEFLLTLNEELEKQEDKRCFVKGEGKERITAIFQSVIYKN